MPGLLFILIIWGVWMFEQVTGTDLYSHGLYPRSGKHWYGIVTSPFLHADFNHLWSNSIPLFVLTTLLVHFYKRIWPFVLFWIWILAGVWVWIAARASFHIGASTIIYGLASFLIFSGLIRGHRALLAISMVVIFLYGSLFWGIFPIKPSTSWEGHLFGAIAGLMVAIAYKKTGPQKKAKIWEESDPGFDWGEGQEPEKYIEHQPEEQHHTPRIFRLRYFYRSRKEDDQE